MTGLLSGGPVAPILLGSAHRSWASPTSRAQTTGATRATLSSVSPNVLSPDQEGTPASQPAPPLSESRGLFPFPGYVPEREAKCRQGCQEASINPVLGRDPVFKACNVPSSRSASAPRLVLSLSFKTPSKKKRYRIHFCIEWKYTSLPPSPGMLLTAPSPHLP